MDKNFEFFGDIKGPVKGCRRLSLMDVLVDRVGDCMDLLLTDVSVVVAHGLCPATDALRLVELCSGIACSGAGLTEVGFCHLASVEWKEPLAALHRSCHPGVPVLSRTSLRIDVPNSCCKNLHLRFPWCLVSAVSRALLGAPKVVRPMNGPRLCLQLCAFVICVSALSFCWSAWPLHGATNSSKLI